jgi:rare lipoprotein A
VLAVVVAGSGARTGHPKPAREVQEGIASWYGPGFHGRRTSSGEVYDQYQLTAAHPTLPLGTRVAVTNLANGRGVEVRINDRGPFVEGRIIDLSYTAAASIGMIAAGTIRVRVEVLRPPQRAAEYAVQVGSFIDADRAERLRRRLSRHFDHVHVARWDNDRHHFHRVRIGPYRERESAVRLADQAARLGFTALVMEVAARG